MMILALVLFVITYILLLSFPKYRAYIAMGTAVLFMILGIQPIKDAFKTDVFSWNVLMMITGTMGIVALFIESKMPSLLADIIIEKTPNVKWCIIALSLFSGLISALVDNVATVLMVAPVALTIAKKQGISPVPSVLAIAVASNLQGAATLVGDTTSILLGAEADMNFFDFFWYQGRPGIFWIVQLGMVAATLILFFVFRKDTQKIEPSERTEVNAYFPSYLLVGMVLLLVIASFIPNMPNEINGYICMGLMFIGLIWKWIKTKDIKSLGETLKEVDIFTILLLAGLFVIIGGLGSVGIIAKLADIIASVGRGNVFLIFTAIVWFSVLISGVIDNIPYVATMLPVVTALTAGLYASGIEVNPNMLYFGLLIGATLGGNLTPIGASANITGIGILRKEGYEVSTKQFMKIGVPYTLAAVITGYILTWLIWR